ncbi:hypothetical protein BGZ68_004931 [Mortierella alpina]|nr:hypothetical protein BGZ68_004931 [Mortierella alpina]
MALEAPEPMQSYKSALDPSLDHHRQQQQDAILALKTTASATLFDTHKAIFPASENIHFESPLDSSCAVDNSAEDAVMAARLIQSPLQERCEDLESELSALRSRLQKSEQSSSRKERRLSEVQQSSSSTQQSLQTLKEQHELTLLQLAKAQFEATTCRQRLEEQGNEVEQLRSQVQEQSRELREILQDRDSLSMEMTECHMDNAKFLKRLRASNDKVERLQHENRHLIEQLRESRAGAAEALRKKEKTAEALEKERARAGEAALDLERVVARYKEEVERLQNLVLAMGHKHVQVQARLNFLQQQAQRQLQAQHSPRLAIEQSGQQEQSSTLPALIRVESDTSKATISSASEPTFAASDPVITDDSLKAILSSVATSAITRRSKPTRRFTVNASFNREEPLSLEQRKCSFLMDQITVLQRGYDSLRQEKLTLELQLDLMQRQYQFHQSQRQNRLDSGRRGVLGQDEFRSQTHRPLPAKALITDTQEPSHDYEVSTSSSTTGNRSPPIVRAGGKGCDPLGSKNDQDYGIEHDCTQSQVNKSEHERGLYQRPAMPSDPETEWMAHATDTQNLKDLDAVNLQQRLSSSRGMQNYGLEASEHLNQQQSEPSLLRELEQRVGKLDLKVSSTSNSPSSFLSSKIQRSRYPREQRERDVEQCSCCMGGLIEV